jgi:hypothetical protein
MKGKTHQKMKRSPVESAHGNLKYDDHWCLSQTKSKCMWTHDEDGVTWVVLVSCLHNPAEAHIQRGCTADLGKAGRSNKDFIVLYWRGGHCFPMHCDLFRSVVLPRIWVLGREYADKILLRGIFFQAWGSLMGLKSQTQDP